MESQNKIIAEGTISNEIISNAITEVSSQKEVGIKKADISFSDCFDDATARGKGVKYLYRIGFNGKEYVGIEKVDFILGDMKNNVENINANFEKMRNRISEKLNQLIK
jgi:hypothetical protein